MPISSNKAIPAHRQTAPGKNCRVHSKDKANFAPDHGLFLAVIVLSPHSGQQAVVGEAIGTLQVGFTHEQSVPRQPYLVYWKQLNVMARFNKRLV